MIKIVLRAVKQIIINAMEQGAPPETQNYPKAV